MKSGMKIFIMAVAVSMSINPLFAEIKVLSVNGNVVFKKGQKWEPLRSLMRLTPGTKVSTGAKSSATLQIEKHTLTISPMTMIKIYEGGDPPKKIAAGDTFAESTTKIGLRRGSIRAKIFREQRVKTEFKVSTPVATSSVRGTEEIISYGPGRGMVIKVLDGTVLGENRNGSSKYLKAGLVFNQRPVNSDPEPLLAHILDNYIANVFPAGTTSDEVSSRGFSREQFFENPEGPGEFLETKVGESENSNVNLFIIWE